MTGEKNPLLDPATCLQMVKAAQKELGKTYSYGGWLEPRHILWRGSYLEEAQSFIHLGIDFNVPAGTAVSFDRSGSIIQVDSDYPDEGGWGTRILFQPDDSGDLFIYAHLDPSVDVSKGESVSEGKIMGRVGKAPFNGGWFPHLHVQVIEANAVNGFLENGLSNLDGYGPETELTTLKQQFKNPLEVLKL